MLTVDEFAAVIVWAITRPPGVDVNILMLAQGPPTRPRFAGKYSQRNNP
jgi:hypothetical protein